MRSFLVCFLLATCIMQLATCPAAEARRWRVSPTMPQAASPLQQVKTGTPGYQSPGEQLLGARVDQLPNDAGKCFTSIYVAASPSARDVQVAGWFKTHRGLLRLREATHFNGMRSDNPLYLARHAQSVGNDFPCVTIQRPDGSLIAKVSGSNMPATADGLATLLARAIENCPRPRPKPEPVPTPQPTPEPAPLPDLLPDPTEPDVQPADDDAIQWAVVIGSFVLAAAGTLLYRATR